MTVSRHWIVGSARDCDMVIPDQYVSPHHCALVRLDDGSTYVADLGSTNGTRVRFDGARAEIFKVTTPRRIRPGDSICVGRTWIPWSRR